MNGCPCWGRGRVASGARAGGIGWTGPSGPSTGAVQGQAQAHGHGMVPSPVPPGDGSGAPRQSRVPCRPQLSALCSGPDTSRSDPGSAAGLPPGAHRRLAGSGSCFGASLAPITALVLRRSSTSLVPAMRADPSACAPGGPSPVAACGHCFSLVCPPLLYPVTACAAASARWWCAACE